MHKKLFLKLFVFLILFSAAFLWFLIGYQFFNLDRCHYDEGIVSYGATRILKGDIPYRDFWTLYAPGHFYLLAGTFKIFGISINVERLLTVTILSLISYSVYSFSSKFISKKFALLGFFFTLIWLKSYVVYSRPIQPAMLFCVLALIPVLNYIQVNKIKWLLVSGILIGVTTLFRQDFGFYIFIAIFLVVLLHNLKISFGNNTMVIIKMSFKKISFLIAGIFIVIVPFVVYFYFNLALLEMIRDAIMFPIKIYPKVRYLPYPKLSVNNIMFYIPFFILFVTFIRLLMVKWRRKVEIESKIWIMTICFFLVLGFLNYVRVRSEHSHLLPAMVPVILLAIFILDDVFKKNLLKFPNFILNIIFIVSFISMFIAVKPSMSYKNVFNLNIKRAEGFYDNSNLAYSQMKAIEFIREKTTPDEKIFVVNTKHNVAVNSDVMFYFLSERDSATKYYELHPRITDTKMVQKTIIQDIKKHNVKYIIQWVRDENLKEPNESSKSSGVFLLDEFINKNYKIEKDFGEYLILRKI